MFELALPGGYTARRIDVNVDDREAFLAARKGANGMGVGASDMAAICDCGYASRPETRNAHGLFMSLLGKMMGYETTTTPNYHIERGIKYEPLCRHVYEQVSHFAVSDPYMWKIHGTNRGPIGAKPIVK